MDDLVAVAGGALLVVVGLTGLLVAVRAGVRHIRHHVMNERINRDIH